MSAATDTGEHGPLIVRAPADDLCLAFTNTRYWRGSPSPTETLAGPEDLVAWLAETCGWPPLAPPVDAAAAFPDALELREAVFRTFAAAAAEQPLPAADLDRVNYALAAVPRRERMALAGEGRGWAVTALPGSVMGRLAPVLWSAADLLLGPRAPRVRQCANPLCGFLFLDDSKSGNRRWCSMSSCGNRAKAHRHYLRHKGQ